MSALQLLSLKTFELVADNASSSDILTNGCNVFGHRCYHSTGKELGNFAEIVKEGGLYEFVINSHKRLGSVL
jgi:hypothetical protein